MPSFSRGSIRRHYPHERTFPPLLCSWPFMFFSLTHAQEILSKDKNAHIITAGDFNEFTFVEPLKQYMQISGLKDMDAVAGIDKLERYTYLFDMNAQQLDHMFISPSLTSKAKYEHVHLTTWVSYDEQVSDHDPSVARMDVCV